MDLQESLVIKNLVKEVKREIMPSSLDTTINVDLVSRLPPSPYDIAWLSMIPIHPHHEPHEPYLFKGCLEWVLNNQNEGGFWGDANVPSLECLTSTLACIVALTTWNIGNATIQKGLAFMYANTKDLLEEQNGCFPEWFVIVFPAMLELAETKGLHVYFCNGSTPLVKQVFLERLLMLKRWNEDEEHDDHGARLTPYCLEALPPQTFDVLNEILLRQKEDGGLQHMYLSSPSAMAYAFMKTRNKGLLADLNCLVQRCGYGGTVRWHHELMKVPAIYPSSPWTEDLLRVCLINRIQTLGLEEQFREDIAHMLAQVYRSYISCEEPKSIAKHMMPLQLYKDSLAFRLLRLHGYRVSPGKLRRLVEDENVRLYIEEKHEIFVSAMYHVYKATDVAFPGDSELEVVRSMAARVLEKKSQLTGHFQNQIQHEMSRSWLARLDHLEHRRCIETKEPIGPWTFNATPFRFMSRVNDAMLLRLAFESYTLRQAIFRDELKKIEVWSKAVGLGDMGFARQKATYCYFAVASTLSLPSLSHVRLVLVKSAILVTVADDFFDKEGSSGELEALANAVERWEHKGLNGHGKTIFKALKDLLDDISAQFFSKNGYHIKRNLQDLWHQTFVSWLKEAEWTRNGHEPSIVEYLRVATRSIASQTILLPAAFLLDPPPKMAILNCPQNEPLTNLLMLLTRLLNDIGSYQKEQEEGKPNLVLLYMKENPKLGIEESIEAIKKIMEEKKKEFLEQALVNDMSDMPHPSKKLYLHCLKAFQMFYNSANAFDSPTALLSDINKAMYEPLTVSAPFDSFETINAVGLKKKDKSFSGYGKLSHGTSSNLSLGISETTCAIKIHGKVSKHFVAKPCFGVSSLEMRKPAIFNPFSKLRISFVCNLGYL